MTKGNTSTAELREVADMLSLGVDSVLWWLPDGVVRLTAADLPTVRAFLAGETDEIALPIVCTPSHCPPDGGGA